MSDEKTTENENMINNTDEQTSAASGETVANAPEENAIPPHKEYAKRLLQFNTFYIQLLLCVGVIIAIGIALAVIYNVVLGAIIALSGALLYRYLAVDEMSKKLGIRYTSGAGGVTVLSCRARYGDVIWIPRKLIWFDVIKIGDKAFASDKNLELKRVFLPKDLKEIGSDIFEGCGALCEIHFEGTQEEWDKIVKKSDLSLYKIYFEAKYPPIPKRKKKKKVK